MKCLRTALSLAAGALALASCNPAPTGEEPKAQAPAKPDDPIASAMFAAPGAVSEKAAIIVANPDTTLKTLREGANGFTCMPDNPVTPGPDPMCMDANALKWAIAWMKHEDPPPETPGFMYMLAGGTDASNSDPFAEKPTEGRDWVKTGPHVMIVGSAKALEGYPSGADPDTSQPYVMWAGTPFAHLMIPVD